MEQPLKILFKYPSRGRPQRFFDALDSIYRNISDTDYYHIACTLDEDDETMNNPAVIEHINAYGTASIQWGKSKSKIDAINRSMPGYDWDIIICMSDDMQFNVFGFDTMIRVDMLTHFSDLDGLLHYPDQDAKQWLATMYIAGRKFYDRFGYIYHPSYKSLWCDNEVMDVARMLGKYKYTGYQINVHLNPAYGHLPKDDMFNEQQGYWTEDEMNYNARKGLNFGI
jgi:hypothetical protein